MGKRAEKGTAEKERRGRQPGTGSAALGGLLAALRLSRGLSLRELGRRIGKAASTVQAWEQGRRMPGLDDLMVLAHELGYELEELVRLAAAPRRQLRQELAATRRELRRLEPGGRPGVAEGEPSRRRLELERRRAFLERLLAASEAAGGERDGAGAALPELARLGALPARRLPVAGEIAAGRPRFALEEAGDFVDVPPGMAAAYALRVVGDSMVGAGIDPGDVVLVRSEEAAEPGAVVVALLGGQEVTVKHLVRVGERYFLRANNPARDYADIPLGPEDRLLGVVEGVLKRPGPPPKEGRARWARS
ncbi:MAG: helix-turn-helix domain-containing protein [Clostridia bacterium]|nr:helix-turn-helix domain-containing protein [Clostridia bacterium]MCL6521535.1 helix-turn-helix domain-containing protein [Bacillota bacterium]